VTIAERNRAADRRRARVESRRAAARAAGLCACCCTRRPRPGSPRCAVCAAVALAACRRARAVKRGDRPARAAKRKPQRRPQQRRPRSQLTIRGESAIERCLREARQAVRVAYGSKGIPSAAVYGTRSHGDRVAYDRAVHVEFVRRLQLAGIPVEGA
jgi:hypothetical protein